MSDPSFLDDIRTQELIDGVKSRLANVSVTEVTQAQYDALPSSKTTDNVTYFVKDAPTGSGVMQGATTTSNGKSGDVPMPYVGDRNRALFGDGHWHNVYTPSTGAMVNVSCGDSSFYGKQVTLTDGVSTLTGILDSSGEYTFTGVTLTGGITVSAINDNDLEALGTISITYFGVYNVRLTSDVAKIAATTTDERFYGRTIYVYKNNSLITTSAFSNSGAADIYVDAVGTYTLRTENGVLVRKVTVEVGALHLTYPAVVRPYEIYAYKVQKANSNPDTSVTPYTDNPDGCDNTGFTPAHMDYTNNVFDYGSWSGDEFFFPKPCMLGYDGDVDYYLDPDDYTKKADGTASDADDASYDGNVMVEFPTIYFKRWEDSTYTYCVISSMKLNSDYKAYAHHDVAGNVLDHIYLNAYDGSYIGGKMRSLSGVACHNRNALTAGYIMSNTTRQQEIDFAAANNAQGETGEGWTIRHKAEGDMVNDLLILLSMSTDTQTAFGKGAVDTYPSGGSATNTGILATGTMDDKGLFWGENQGKQGVKVFGIENWWGNIWKSMYGWINDSGTQKVKMTYGTEDGSSTTGFNLTGSGYVNITGATPSGTYGGFVSQWKYGEQGLVPYYAAGSDSTYLCDGLLFANNKTCVALSGGSADGSGVGAFYASLDSTAPYAAWYNGAALTYKGIAA